MPSQDEERVQRVARVLASRYGDETPTWWCAAEAVLSALTPELSALEEMRERVERLEYAIAGLLPPDPRWFSVTEGISPRHELVVATGDLWEWSFTLGKLRAARAALTTEKGG